MNRNSEAIIILCSHLCTSEEIKPLEAHEWSQLAQKLLERNLQPETLLDYERQDFISELSFSESEAIRYMRLLDRSGSLRFELARYEDMGIQIVTRADSVYPKKLKSKLSNACPPLFYCAGELSLLNGPAVGYVGSRNIELQDSNFTKKAVAATARRGYAVVSGGAKGVDSVSASAAMSENVAVIEYLSDSMLRKMRDSGLISKIRDGRILLMSAVAPTAGFNVGTAMMRNRYIYAQSDGTVVVHSDKGKGGTWAGAIENLKKKLCPTFCYDYDYPGNQELICRGAIPIAEDWDGNINAAEKPLPVTPQIVTENKEAEQISFDELLQTSAPSVK